MLLTAIRVARLSSVYVCTHLCCARGLSDAERYKPRKVGADDGQQRCEFIYVRSGYYICGGEPDESVACGELRIAQVFASGSE